jgi:ABC-type multidrug transport system permease subunit
MRNLFFIAWQDVRYQLRQGSTLVWLIVMPPIFFYFIGTVTGGFSGGSSGATATPVTVTAEQPGFLRDQIDLRLRDNDFDPTWTEALAPADADEVPTRTLAFDPGLSDEIVADNIVTATFDTKASALRRDFEIIRVQRSLYTALADIAIAEASSPDPLDAEALIALNNEPRIWQLDVSPAGKRQEIPTGFEQTIPGILVMFTLLILLTSGGTMLVIERRDGLLRRLASAPISRSEVVAGKWAGRMVLATIQIGVALVIGTFLFRMDWGPDLGMVAVVLAAWGAFCASAGLWLGTIARTEGQAGGLGVLAANGLAALGGCWWPIEITPGWMQAVQNFLPTGWAMDALHNLISFQSGAVSAVPQVVALASGALVIGVLAIRRFEYQ